MAKNLQMVRYEGAKPNPGPVKHFSHRHYLRRYQVQESDDIECKICQGSVEGEAYGCKNCRYYLHRLCYNWPQKIQHDSHKHSLTFCTAYDSGEFICDGCGLYGKGFSYNCSTCKYDLHYKCACFPKTLSNKLKYEITLYYSFPMKEEAAPLICDICLKPVNKERWLYFNRYADYIAHVYCAYKKSNRDQSGKDFFDAVLEELESLRLT